MATILSQRSQSAMPSGDSFAVSWVQFSTFQANEVAPTTIIAIHKFMSKLIEIITSQILPNAFNSDDGLAEEFDGRSDDKGPEPEALAVGTVGNYTYAFIGLERVGGIMVYDITDPANSKFVQFLSTTNYQDG